MAQARLRNAVARLPASGAKAKRLAIAAQRPGKAEPQEVKIGGRLKHARLVQKLRLRELANRLHCSESFLSKLENDKVRPSLAMLHRIVGILDINIAALFAEAPDNEPVRLLAMMQLRPIEVAPLTRPPRPRALHPPCGQSHQDYCAPL